MAKVIEIYEGDIYRENFELSPFRKVMEKLFFLKQKYKNEIYRLLQGLVQLVMESLYGLQIRKDNNESFYCKSEVWMKKQIMMKTFWITGNCQMKVIL